MDTATDRRELLTVDEVAARLRLHPITVRRKIHAGEIQAHQLGGRGASIRVEAGDLERWLHRTRPETR